MKRLFNSIYNKKRVLITGHTGFKGAWLALILNKLGAEVYGYALEPPTKPSLFEEAGLNEFVHSKIGDVRNLSILSNCIQESQPHIVFHMAAQPLVRDSYKIPVETYSTNIMGTVHLLEACRLVKSIKAIVNVTTDKCYENQEWHWGYRENEPMGGFDPYSNSKACSELVTSSYRNSFFNRNTYEKHGVALASARAGNVIGGGDWALDRLIPDFIRAISNNETLKIRNPYAIRPWQHVMEPLTGYLMLGQRLYQGGSDFAEAWNFGPDDKVARNVEWIANKLCEQWNEGTAIEIDNNPQPHEANYLKLDCSKAKAELGWQPRWDIHKALESIVAWNKAFLKGDDIRQITEKQIKDYYNTELKE